MSSLNTIKWEYLHGGLLTCQASNSTGWNNVSNPLTWDIIVVLGIRCWSFDNETWPHIILDVFYALLGSVTYSQRHVNDQQGISNPRYERKNTLRYDSGIFGRSNERNKGKCSYTTRMNHITWDNHVRGLTKYIHTLVTWLRVLF